MNIVTKYDVGHKFWVPRSYDRHVTEELEHEGLTWFRKERIFEPVAKQKEIIKIEISISPSFEPLIQYYCVNVLDAYLTLSQVYSEDQIHEYTEEEALTVAKQYADKNEAYYGT